MKKCPDDKILNPKTNRCVKKEGKIGKALLEKEEVSPIEFDDIMNLKHTGPIVLKNISLMNTIKYLIATKKVHIVKEIINITYPLDAFDIYIDAEYDWKCLYPLNKLKNYLLYCSEKKIAVLIKHEDEYHVLCIYENKTEYKKLFQEGKKPSDQTSRLLDILTDISSILIFNKDYLLNSDPKKWKQQNMEYFKPKNFEAKTLTTMSKQDYKPFLKYKEENRDYFKRGDLYVSLKDNYDYIDLFIHDYDSTLAHTKYKYGFVKKEYTSETFTPIWKKAYILLLTYVNNKKQNKLIYPPQYPLFIKR
jgi:hypothetical protein